MNFKELKKKFSKKQEKSTKSLNKRGETEYKNKEGKLHNTFGPAVVSAYNPPEYWVNGKEISKREWTKKYGK